MAHKIDLWFELFFGADGVSIWGFKRNPQLLRNSEKRGYYFFEGKEYTVHVLTDESYETTRKMIYAWMRAYLKGSVQGVNLNE